LPKVGAMAVMVRLLSGAADQASLAVLLACLAAASMVYGNLIALQQKDLKRLLGFSGIAHAGYALVGLVALDSAGFTAALYYILSYLFMVQACMLVVCRVSTDGANVSLDGLAGLHRRSPLLAVALIVGVFGLAGLPPFAGFMGKLALLKAAFARGHLALVILTVVNSAIAIYYYLCIIREAFFRDAAEAPPIRLPVSIRLAAILLVAAILMLGLAPGSVLEAIAAALGPLASAAGAAR
jgi:NADH-quinone oxidoreductase subunit N